MPATDQEEEEEAPRRLCGACGESKAREAFSKKKWQKKQGRRCIACIQAGVALDHGCNNNSATVQHLDRVSPNVAEEMMSIGVDGLEKGLKALIDLGESGRRDEDPLQHANAILRQKLKAEGLDKAVDDKGLIDKKKMSSFFIRYHAQIASFAAVNFNKFGQGAVFLFTKIAWDDLLDNDPTASHSSHGPLGAYKLDRQFVLVWGDRPGENKKKSTSRLRAKRSRFSARDLSEKFQNYVKTLPAQMDLCSRDVFPLVVCSDPIGECFPDILQDLIRPAKNPHPHDLRYSRGQVMTNVACLRFFDFDSMLEAGSKMPEMECYAVNMDRDYTDPNVR